MFSTQLQASELLGNVSATQVKNKLSVFQKRVGAVLFGIALIGGMLAGNMLLKGTSKQAFNLVVSGSLLATAIVVATQVLPDAKKADEQEAAQAEEEIAIQMSEVEDVYIATEEEREFWKQMSRQEEALRAAATAQPAEVSEVAQTQLPQKQAIAEAERKLEENLAAQDNLVQNYNNDLEAAHKRALRYMNRYRLAQSCTWTRPVGTAREISNEYASEKLALRMEYNRELTELQKQEEELRNKLKRL